ncbi:helix-turn-helix domain-containing protein [Saccharospirillum impatiens]|uniref:helix-turn-helix domain-containing protein n=1 Tax=Saccharospirillum impatiens TaxID=169438 RepID=UPI000417774F|nr:XRE family transcriptional regulator [Saccharospirillum impatiens]
MSDIQQQFAHRLKELRAARGWSLARAATETGVSKAMLGQIERGESSPTLTTLWRLAKGFDVGFSTLIEPVDASSGSFQTRVTPPDSALTVKTLLPFVADLHTEMLDVEIEAGGMRESDSHRQGVIECVLVQSGELAVYSDARWHRLQAGDAYRFRADQPHAYRNESQDKPAQFLNLLVYR